MLEKRWGWKSTGEGGLRVLSLSSPIALPLCGLVVNIFAADWPLIKDHTPSAGGLAREGGVDEVWKRRRFHLVVT